MKRFGVDFHISHVHSSISLFKLCHCNGVGLIFRKSGKLQMIYDSLFGLTNTHNIQLYKYILETFFNHTYYTILGTYLYYDT